MEAHKLLSYLFAAVWLVNGLLCKVLDLVPRHREIVARILGETHSGALTVTIGLLEIGMAVWIISGVAGRLNAVTQVCIVLTMNVIEFFVVPDLLLWGRANMLIAIAFVLLIYYNEFHLKQVSR